jgi:hypothetical protein
MRRSSVLSLPFQLVVHAVIYTVTAYYTPTPIMGLKLFVELNPGTRGACF